MKFWELSFHCLDYPLTKIGRLPYIICDIDFWDWPEVGRNIECPEKMDCGSQLDGPPRYTSRNRQSIFILFCFSYKDFQVHDLLLDISEPYYLLYFLFRYGLKTTLARRGPANKRTDTGITGEMMPTSSYFC